MTVDREKQVVFPVTCHLSPVAFLNGWQLSAGDLSEWARPAVFAAAAVVSVWVFHDARGRAEFGRPAVCAWALLTLLFPPVALPLYLAARLYTRRAATDEDEPTEAGDGPTGEAATAAEAAGKAEGDDEGGAVEDAGEGSVAGPARAPLGSASGLLGRLGPTLLYAAVLAVAGAAYFYADSRSFDARLARAERAKLYQRSDEAVHEYRAALRVREDAHTRKLLALELLQLNRAEEALAELLVAAREAASDETLDFHTAAALGALGRHEEAARHYRRFLAGPACAPPPREEKCEAAAARLSAHETEAAPAH